MHRRYSKRSTGETPCTPSAAVGYNIRRLLPVIARLELGSSFCALLVLLNQYQGNLLSRPLTPREFADLARSFQLRSSSTPAAAGALPPLYAAATGNTEAVTNA
jgi:hypothetical protein